MGTNVVPRTRLNALDVACRIFEALDTPRSLTCYMLLKNNEHKQLIELGCLPSNYASEHDFFCAYQATKLLSKSLELDTGIDPDRVAVSAVIAAELSCRKTNDRFREGFVDKPRVSSLLSRMQRKIALILGDCPSFEQLDLAFGPGSTFGVRKMTSVFHKAEQPYECTYAFSSIVGDLLEELPGLTGDVDSVDVRLVEGNELTFVPKNAKTSRPIAIEPTLNALAQKGIGSHIRRRLSRWGVDLNDQSLNQYLAKTAFYESLATVDLKSASDTISYGLVLDLLPIEWFNLLDRCRSPNFLFEGKWYPYQKFSSMGNAYTFELESLIFYACASCVCEEYDIPYSTGVTLSVYGDDIIVPKDAFEPLRWALEELGFTVNREKTFFEGNFFESCGHDYFRGIFVRPVYLNRKLENHVIDSNKAINDIWRIQKILSSFGKRAFKQIYRLERVRHWSMSMVPYRLRRFGPSRIGLHSRLSVASGDGWIFSASHEHLAVPRGGYAAPAWAFEPRSVVIPDDASPRAVMAYAIYSPRTQFQSDDYRSKLYDVPWNDLSPSGKGSVSIRDRGRTVLRKLDIPFWIHETWIS